MPLKVNPVREVTIHQTTSDRQEFSVTFKFRASEDIDYPKFREIMKDRSPMKIVNTDTGQEEEKDSGFINAYFYTLRSSISNWTNIEDTDGNLLPVKDKDGKIIENNQIVVFEACRLQEGMMDKISTAYLGLKEKNL
jgi:hypothetical protein